MLSSILIILGLLIIACSVVLVFDARTLSSRFFSFGSKNDVTLVLKIFGFILGIIGLLIIYFVLR